jgi:hypothetical protein
MHDFKTRTMWIDDAEREVPRMLEGSPEIVERALKGRAPCVEYTDLTIALPLTKPSEPFGDEIDFVQSRQLLVPGVALSDSSFVVNGILQVDLLVVGYAMRLRMSPTRFLVDGLTSDGRRAHLRFGGADALAHLMGAYQFAMTAMQRIRLVQEPLMNVAVIDMPTDDLAADGAVPVSGYVDEVNKELADSVPKFLPTSTAVTPVRDRPRVMAAQHRFAKPVLLRQGIPLWAGLHLANSHEQKLLWNAVSCNLQSDPALYHGGTVGICFELYGFEMHGPVMKVVREKGLGDKIEVVGALR